MNINSKSKKTGIREYIFIGIFSALTAMGVMLAGIISSLFGPIGHNLFGHAMLGFVSGPIFVLLSKKTNTKWLFTSVFFVVMMIFQIMGMGYLPWFLTTMSGAIIGDLLCLRSSYDNTKLFALGHGFCLIGIAGGSLVPMIFFAESFRKEWIARGQDPQYMEQTISFFTGPMIILAVILALVFGIIGIYMGKKIFEKHFKKAGLV